MNHSQQKNKYKIINNKHKKKRTLFIRRWKLKKNLKLYYNRKITINRDIKKKDPALIK